MTATSLRTSDDRDRADRWPAAAGIAGGTAVIVGAALPWLTLLAGLQTFTGLDGANGRVLAAGGALAIVLGAASLRPVPPLLRSAVGVVGFALLAFSSWLLVSLFVTYRELAADAFALAGLGPGLFVATVGAAVVFLPLLRSRGVATDGSLLSRRHRLPLLSLAAGSLAAGVLHLAVSGEHPIGGAAFLAVGLAQVLGGALIVVHPTRRALHAVAALHAAALLAFALTQGGVLTGLHTGGHHGAHIALAAITAEAAVVVGAVSMAQHRRR